MSLKRKKWLIAIACALALAVGLAAFAGWLVCPADVFIQRRLGEVIAIRYIDHASQGRHETSDPEEIAAFLALMHQATACRWYTDNSGVEGSRLYITLTCRAPGGETVEQGLQVYEPQIGEMGGVNYRFFNMPGVFDFAGLPNLSFVYNKHP